MYWQVYDVIEPRYSSMRPSDLIMYVRAWSTGKDMRLASKPRVFRIEFRPGFFSDYQLVSDGPIFGSQGSIWQIGGPVHSNGYPGPKWFSGDTKGIKSKGMATCFGRARLSTSHDAEIDVPGCSGGFIGGISRKRSREVNINVVNDSFKYIKSRCGVVAYVTCATGRGPYDVTMSAGGISWTSENGGGGFAAAGGNVRNGDANSAVVLFNDEVRVSGSVSGMGVRASRVTIAAYREDPNALPANIVLRGGGTVGGANPRTDSVGLVAQGDVILDVPPEGQCLGTVNAAVATAGGGVTMPQSLLTLTKPAADVSSSNCGNITLTGSYVAHNPPRTFVRWTNKDGDEVGRAGYGTANYNYSDALYVNPPPLFPTSRPWAMTKVADAKNVCLTTRAGDPTCA